MRLAESIKHIVGHLIDRSAVLFLGAGVSFGTKNDSGDVFPLASDLTANIARDLLHDSELKGDLSEVSEMARFALGDRALNEYLFAKFNPFNPSTAHLALAQLPWDVIYTTNYDLLLERAFRSGIVQAAGEIRQVFSNTADLTSFTEDDILYYKLHGSIDHANTVEGRLILTKEDYRYYEAHRKPLFARLRRDLQSKTFVFVGYSLKDDNFLAILEDVRQVVDTKSLPLSFAIRRSFRPAEESFWREKYNIQLLDEDAGSSPAFAVNSLMGRALHS